MTFRYTALVTIAMLVTYLWTGVEVGKARRRHGVKAPATTGPDDFNRVFRAHANTLEQLALMLPALWLFAYATRDAWAGLLGLVWIAGRVIYVRAYSQAADTRGTGFLIGFAAFAVACLGTVGGILLYGFN
jgi:glutathione S-transferase